MYKLSDYSDYSGFIKALTLQSVEGQLIQLEEANKDLKVCLCHEKDMREKGQADLEDRKADCSKFQNEILSLQEKLTRF